MASEKMLRQAFASLTVHKHAHINTENCMINLLCFLKPSGTNWTASVVFFAAVLFVIWGQICEVREMAGCRHVRWELARRAACFRHMAQLSESQSLNLLDFPWSLHFPGACLQFHNRRVLNNERWCWLEIYEVPMKLTWWNILPHAFFFCMCQRTNIWDQQGLVL